MRLFVAVEVPDEVRSAVAAAITPLRSAAPRLRWVAPDRYHLTVLFLGTVDSGRAPAVAAALAAGCRGVEPFALALDGRVGTFGRRVLWAGLRDSPALAALAARVRDSVGDIVDLPDGDRPFSAHLTLARAGKEPVRAPLAAGAQMPALSWRVKRVALMESAGGYRVVEAVDLPGTGA